MEIVVILILALAAWMLVPRLVGRGFSALNRKVLQPNAHAKGQAIVSQQLRFSSGIEPEAVVEQLRTAVGALEGASRGIARPTVQVDTSNENCILFTCGTTLYTSWAAKLTVAASTLGSEGSFRVESWREDDGLVTSLEQLEALVSAVRDSLQRPPVSGRLNVQD